MNLMGCQKLKYNPGPSYRAQWEIFIQRSGKTASSEKNCIDYYTFGMQMPGRSHQTSEYSYGFQGQLKDDEIKGEGNSVNFKFRMHDPRIGRFFAMDPLADEYPHNSPYVFSENTVVNAVELEGLEKYTLFTSGPLAGNNAYFTSSTTQDKDLLFIADDQFIRRNFTSNEKRNNSQLVRTLEHVPDRKRARITLPGSSIPADVEQAKKTPLREFGDATQIAITRIGENRGGTYNLTTDPANTVQNEITGSNSNNGVTATFPVAGGANRGFVSLDPTSLNGPGQTFQLTDESGNIIPLVDLSTTIPIITNSGTSRAVPAGPSSGGPRMYAFGVPDGQTNLNITITSNEGGSFRALTSTIGPDNKATTTNSNPSQSGDVKVSTNGTVVGPRKKNNGGGKAVNQ